MGRTTAEMFLGGPMGPIQTVQGSCAGVLYTYICIATRFSDQASRVQTPLLLPNEFSMLHCRLLTRVPVHPDLE